MHGEKIRKALCVLFAGCALFAGGCGCMPDTEKSAEQTGPAYGVADLETLVKAHPRYSDYFRLQKEYEELLSEYRSDQERIMHLAMQQEQAAAPVAQLSAENEFRVRMKIKETSLNQQLENLYREISARHSGDPDSHTIAGDGDTEIANLQIKLKVLGVSGSQKEEAESELQTLLNGRRTEVNTAGWTEEEKAQAAAKKAEAEAELSAYATQISGEIRENHLNAMQSLEKFGIPVADEFNKAWADALRAKQKEMAAVHDIIMFDVRSKAADVAKKKKIDMIFVEYDVNLKAEDVTAEIANQIVLMK